MNPSTCWEPSKCLFFRAPVHPPSGGSGAIMDASMCTDVYMFIYKPLGIRLLFVRKWQSIKAIWIGTEMKTHSSFNTNCRKMHHFFSFILHEQLSINNILLVLYLFIFWAASLQPPVDFWTSLRLVATCDDYIAGRIHIYEIKPVEILPPEAAAP